MKAKEVLRRYAAGERNFQRVNLRGQSFKGADLSGADFSEADIRSTNFKNANLQGVNFTGAKAGLQKQLLALFLVGYIFISLLSGAYWIYLGSLMLLLLGSSESKNFYSGLYSLFIFGIFLVITVRKGIMAGVITATTTVVIAEVGPFVGSSTIFIAIASAAIIAIFGTVVLAIAKVGALIGVIALIVIIAGVIASVEAKVGVLAGVATGAFSLFGLFIGWNAVNDDERDTLVRSFAVAFAATGGTSFQGANLIDAIFARAILKNTDFRKATLTRTCFRNAKKLELARPGNTYLKISKLQQWLTGTGQDNNFDGLVLRGVNLQGKILTDASFIGADLSEANFQDADLSRATLVQTQLDGTDFTGATLTGAFIEDWGITSDTNLRGVRCDYIYLRLPTKEDPDPHRKPDNRSELFADGDFENFIQPIFDTLDLYHNQNIDPRVIALSWNKLAENNPDANLRFASMEVKGEDNLLLRLKTSTNTDKSQLSAEYFEEYNRIKALNEANEKLLASKDQEIQRLETFVTIALQNSKSHIAGDYIEGNKSDQSSKVEVSDGTIHASGTDVF